MRRSNMETAGNVLKDLLQNSPISSGMSQQDAINVWPKVAGEAIARYTKNVSIYNGTLFVQLKSSVAADAIRTQQAELIAKMNAELGMNVVKEIRTR